ncbi:MAG: carboxypeptidase-like regulatory domain-containing protein, partial [Bacteroidota bacterium]
NKTNTFFLFVFCVFFMGNEIIAQGVLKGKITDGESNEELYGVNYSVYKNGLFIQGGITNERGDYDIRLPAGRYDIEFIYLGYPDKKILNLPIVNHVVKKLDIQIVKNPKHDGCHNKKGSTTITVIKEYPNFGRQASRDINEILLAIPGVSFTQ